MRPPDGAPMLVGDLAHRGAQLWPDRVAVSWGGNERSYGELGERVPRLASALHDRGVRAGTRLATYASNHPDVLEFCLAASLVGAVVVPLNTRLAPNEVRYQLDDADVTHALVDPLLEEPAREADVLARDHWFIGPEIDASVVASEPVPSGFDRPSPQDPWIHLYTSGTTGRPKGCLLGQAGWLASNANAAHGLGLEAEDRVFAFAPFFHVAGFGIALTTLTLGGEVAVPPGLQPAEVWGHVAERKITVLQYPFLRMLLEDSAAEDSDRDSLRLITGGAAMEPTSTFDAMEEVVPGCAFRGIYGSTEAGNYTTLSTMESERTRPGTVGQPLMNFDVAVVDADDNPLPTGEAGELVLRGPSTMLGYWKRPGETEQALRGGWLHTGDIMRRDADGFLYFVDRSKDMIKSGGENVYSVEVEQILETHPGVADVAVVGVPDSRWGEAVKAIVVLAGDDVPSPEDLDALCRGRMGDFKRPRWYEFTETIPRSVLGKVLKRELRDAHDPDVSIRLEERS